MISEFEGAAFRPSIKFKLNKDVGNDSLNETNFEDKESHVELVDYRFTKNPDVTGDQADADTTPNNILGTLCKYGDIKRINKSKDNGRFKK